MTIQAWQFNVFPCFLIYVSHRGTGGRARQRFAVAPVFHFLATNFLIFDRQLEIGEGVTSPEILGVNYMLLQPR